MAMSRPRRGPQMAKSSEGLCMFQYSRSSLREDALKFGAENLPRPRSPHDRRMIAKFWRCYRGWLEDLGGRLDYKAPRWKSAQGELGWK